MGDANVLSRTARAEINKTLSELEKQTHYKLIVVTTRDVDYEPDVFSLAEKIFGKWFAAPTNQKGGLLLLTTKGKEGAIVGDTTLLEALGDNVVDSIVGENIAILA